MTTPLTSSLFKIFRFLEVAFFVGAVLIAAALVTGKIWLEHHFLRQEVHLGDGSLQIYGGKLYWDLQVLCDSARYDSPALHARAGKTDVYVNPAGYFIPGASLATVHFDTLFIRIKPGTSKPVHQSPDSLSFPALKMPVRVSLGVRAFALANDSGMLVAAWKVHVHNPSGERMDASIGTLASPLAGSLRPSLSVHLDWSATDSVDLELKVLREKDQVYLTTRHAKASLLRGRGSLQIQAADSRPYMEALGLARKKLPFAQAIHLDVNAARKDSLEGHVFLQAEVSGFSNSLPVILSSQQLEVHVDGRQGASRWQVKSQGRAGEELLLNGEVKEIPVPGNSSLPLPLWRHFAVSVLGSAEKFRVRANKKILLAGAHLERARWDGRNLSAALTTNDSSKVEAQGRQIRGNWTGKFAVRLAPKERWVTAFFDTNISFAALEANGNVQGKTVTASMNARHVFAYGVKVDSLSSSNLYGPQGYVLKSSSLYANGKTWSLSGKVETDKRVSSLDFQLESPGHGSLEYFLQQDSMQVTAKQFELAGVPYALVTKLPVQNPIVDGTFQWNTKRRDGSVDAQVVAEFQKEKIDIGAKAHWDPQLLNAEKLTLDYKASSLAVGARIKLHGRQFYELSKLRVPDYEYVSVETPHLDMAQALSLFQPQPFLKSGQVQGKLAYADSGGFQGSLVFSSIASKAEVGDVTLKRLQLDGTGDSLIVLGVTRSESMPLLRDSLRIAVTQALEDTQHIHIEAVANDSLRLQLDAASSHFQALQGRLQVQGKATLPDNSGILESLQTDLNFSFPFRNTLAQAQFTTRTFQGDYVIPSVSREHFSLNPELRAGTISVSQLSLKDSSGSTLQGTAEYALKNGALHAHFSGGDLTAQWTADDKVSLKNLNLDYALDSMGMRLKGGFSQGTLQYVDIPLDAKGTLQDVTFTYTLPPTSIHHTGKRVPPALEFSGAISQSLIRYSLKSLTAIQAVFQKEHNKKRGGGGKVQPIQLDVKLYTLGDSNRVDSDILRMAWVGNLEMHGLYPFTLVQGRINTLNGELGLPNQAYQIQQLEVKWLDAPLEEGEVQMEARKNLASSCQKNSAPTDFAAQDSCAVIVQLHGPLSQMQFTYDSDCGGAFGAGANMVAILTSVERGCYDASLANSGGSGYGGTALSLLEPTLSQNLSTLLGRYSHSWIAETEVTGLSSLAGGRDTVNDSIAQALSVEITSKEFLHVRLQVKSGYHTESQDLSSPWENMLALEWRPPLDAYVEDPVWKERLHNHVSVTASIQTIAVERDEPDENPVQKTLALAYIYDFWGRWWDKPKRLVPKTDTTFKAQGKQP